MKINNYVVRTIVTAIVYSGTVSCQSEWLDVKADKSLVIPETYEDLQGLLDDSSVMNGRVPCLGEIAADGHYITEAAWMGNLYDAERNAYTWSNSYWGNDLEAYEWTLSYNKILYSNVVLDGLARMKDRGGVKWNHIYGQALFARARDHYYLTRLFAPPFDEHTADSDLGIPMRLSSDISVPSTRSTNSEVYGSIISDLRRACQSLPLFDVTPVRASKVAAYALLSRIYLDMEEYANALMFADSTLLYKSDLQDYGQLDLTASYVAAPQEILFFEELRTYSSLTSNYRIEEELYGSYDEEDLRKQAFFRVNNGIITFKGNYNPYRPATPFAGMATDEVYLIRAECQARLGDYQSAMITLNTLMRSRWNKSVQFPEFTAADADEALLKILGERRKELLLRGLRWSDLRRLNKDTRFRVTLSRQIGEETYTLEPDSYRYTFPIPVDIITMTRMQQNPGW